MGHAPLIGLIVLALGLRLLVWRWHALYPLGGDEREYFEQALTLLREHRYAELRLMRPPLYTGFLAVCTLLFDSLVQRLRLIQEIISACTVVPIYALTQRLFGDRRVALVAGLLTAANYTLAANATELLTETLFLFGLATLFWLLLRARTRPRYAVLAGLTLGMLALLRSVALPLLPLGALWLLGRRPTTDDRPPTEDRSSILHPPSSILHPPSSVIGWFILATVLVIGPWTLRNQLTYGAPILVDTTGAENLWLDNDPAGREAVKQQLYDLEDDRATRQRVALQRGAAAIVGDPQRFVAKAWGEAQKFFALQYFDDMRERRAIWVPPPEVWLRLLLGDGAWLIILVGGAVGIWLAPTNDQRPTTNDQRPTTDDKETSRQADKQAANPKLKTQHSKLKTSPPSSILDPRWLLVPWGLYTLLTALLFHVELRYRLPLYPLLLPYAAWALTQIADFRLQISDWRAFRFKIMLAGLTWLVLGGLLLLHRPYIGEAWMLSWKHARLWQAERAIAGGDAAGARSAAQAALGWDADSALARVALARAALLAGDRQAAEDALGAAITALRAHPYAHLLRGALLREQGNAQAARQEFSFENDSLEDLQGWAWRTFAPVQSRPTAIDVGGGLDLGFVSGFSLPENGGFRWSGTASQVLLRVPPGAARLDLRLASGRPPGAPPATLIVSADGREIGRIQPAAGWHIYSMPLLRPPGSLVLTLGGNTFRPRDYDRASPDDRTLGVMVSRVAIGAP